MSPWNYPGFYPGLAAPVGPKQGPYGRNNGVTAWGQFMGGKAKYYIGAYDLDDSRVKRFYSGRVNLAILGTEPGFYHSSTYYGAQDILAIGGGFQYQTDGFAPGANLSIFNADLLFEKNLGGGGVVTFEGAYHHSSDGNTFKNAYYLLGSWLTPEKLGIGKLQPLIRFQQTTDVDRWMLDTFVTYVVDDYFTRIALGFQHADVGVAPNANMIQIGVQLQR
jgi:hypothetical protein